MSNTSPAFFILYLESFISQISNEILCHDFTLSVGELTDNAAAKTGAGTAFGVNGDHEQGLCFSHVLLCKIFFNALRFDFRNSQCCTERASKYRPVATNFQCLKNCCPHGLTLVGVRLLHLLRKPCCHSKAPLGLSLLRNRGLVGECLPQTLLQRCAGFAQKRRVALHSPLHPGAGIYHFHRRSNMTEKNEKSERAHFLRENRNDTPRNERHIIKVE